MVCLQAGCIMYVLLLWQMNMLYFPGLNPQISTYTGHTVTVLKVNIFMLFRLAQCCHVLAAEMIYRERRSRRRRRRTLLECGKLSLWETTQQGINTYVYMCTGFTVIPQSCAAWMQVHTYCLLSYMASITLIGLTVVEELAHNLVHRSSQAPP